LTGNPGSIHLKAGKDQPALPATPGLAAAMNASLGVVLAAAQWWYYFSFCTFKIELHSSSVFKRLTPCNFQSQNSEFY
jgi:hypothetical protein